ncbi:hypothetical protein D9M68_651320 [compost metagenome]
MKRILDFAHLNAADEVRERSPDRCCHQTDLARNGISVVGRDRYALQGNEHFDPLASPGPIAIG